jgi:hypothetical protein
MHTNLCNAGPRASELGGWGLSVLAAVLLSVGVGAATAAFMVMNGAASHSASFSSCGTMLEMASDLDALPLAPLFAAGAVAMLVACARGAARLLDEPRSTGVIAASAIGALVLAASLSRVLGLPALGTREELVPARA